MTTVAALIGASVASNASSSRSWLDAIYECTFTDFTVTLDMLWVYAALLVAVLAVGVKLLVRGKAGNRRGLLFGGIVLIVLSLAGLLCVGWALMG